VGRQRLPLHYNARVIPRFYVPALAPDLPRVALPEEEAHHLAHVCRLAVGDPVRLFDGRGLEVLARVADVGRRTVVAEVVRPVTARPEPAVRVTVLLGVLRADRMDDAVRDATMLGVAEIRPVRSAHTAVPVRAVSGDRPVARWHRVAVSGAKQCGRAVVPAIAAVASWSDALGAALPAVRLLLVEPSAGVAGRAVLEDLAEAARAGGAALAIGPEGGWEPDEIALAEAAGFQAWSLGALTLRADAVPVAALAVLHYAWARGD